MKKVTFMVLKTTQLRLQFTIVKFRVTKHTKINNIISIGGLIVKKFLVILVIAAMVTGAALPAFASRGRRSGGGGDDEGQRIERNDDHDRGGRGDHDRGDRSDSGRGDRSDGDRGGRSDGDRGGRSDSGDRGGNHRDRSDNGRGNRDNSGSDGSDNRRDVNGATLEVNSQAETFQTHIAPMMTMMRTLTEPQDDETFAALRGASEVQKTLFIGDDGEPTEPTVADVERMIEIFKDGEVYNNWSDEQKEEFDEEVYGSDGYLQKVENYWNTVQKRLDTAKERVEAASQDFDNIKDLTDDEGEKLFTHSESIDVTLPPNGKPGSTSEYGVKITRGSQSNNDLVLSVEEDKDLIGVVKITVNSNNKNFPPVTYYVDLSKGLEDVNLDEIITQGNVASVYVERLDVNPKVPEPVGKFTFSPSSGKPEDPEDPENPEDPVTPNPPTITGGDPITDPGSGGGSAPFDAVASISGLIDIFDAEVPLAGLPFCPNCERELAENDMIFRITGQYCRQCYDE